MEMSQVVICGVGGVGTKILTPLCQYLTYKHPKTEVVLIDGDAFEPRNQERQDFDELGNKAEVKVGELRKKFPGLSFEAKPDYVTEENVYVFVPEGSIVFACVDNHASRKLLSDHCQTLSDVMLVSGGNEFDDGGVQLYIRRGGEDLTPPLTAFHKEIATPPDRNPAELSCEQRAAQGEPQLVFANFKVAAEMLGAFWMGMEKKIAYSDLYFDLKNGAQRATLRKGKLQ